MITAEQFYVNYEFEDEPVNGFDSWTENQFIEVMEAYHQYKMKESLQNFEIPNFKGTKGDWKHDVKYRGGCKDPLIQVVIPRDRVPLRLNLGSISSDECTVESCCCVEEHANAHLIASAPILLGALTELLHLHACEQEGIASGQPTSKQWIEATNKGMLATNKALGHGIE